MSRILSWDPATGIAELEPGVTVEQLWKHILPDGWWPAVVSGTAFPTVAGALAMNIHGKNNYKVGPLGDQCHLGQDPDHQRAQRDRGNGGDRVADQCLQSGEERHRDDRQRQQANQDANSREPFDRHRWRSLASRKQRAASGAAPEADPLARSSTPGDCGGRRSG